MKNLKVGDSVMWRGGFGVDTPKKVKVVGIEICKDGSKHGDSVDSVSWDKVSSRNVVVDLDNDHWAYGTQIKSLK